MPREGHGARGGMRRRSLRDEDGHAGDAQRRGGGGHLAQVAVGERAREEEESPPRLSSVWLANCNGLCLHCKDELAACGSPPRLLVARHDLLPLEHRVALHLWFGE